MNRRTRRRSFLAGAALALLVAGTGGCTHDATDHPGAVKIGLLVSLSGTYQSVGTDMRDGFP